MTATTAQKALDPMVCFAIYSVERRIGQLYRELLAPWGLSYTQYLVLISLWGDGSLTVSRLGALLGLDSGTLSPLLKRLETRGYLSRTRSAADERVVEVTLTEAGLALREELSEVPRCFAERTGLSEEEYVQLLTLTKALDSRLAPASPARKES